MDLNEGPGSTVRFLNKNGQDEEPEDACEDGLIEDKIYVVVQLAVHEDSSSVELEGFDKMYNTVMFNPVEKTCEIDWFGMKYGRK